MFELIFIFLKFTFNLNSILISAFNPSSYMLRGGHVCVKTQCLFHASESCGTG